MTNVVAARLRAQRLTGSGFASAVETVRYFGAVQAQDYPAAKWALGLRVKDATDAGIDRACEEGAILRTHILRPTWHFVAPEDIRWMTALTGPKIRQGMTGRHRDLELDARTIARAHAVFEKALAGGNHLTRAELGQALSGAGIAPDGQRLPHLIMAAELTALLTSGPRKRAQPTFMLLEERAPAAPTLEHDEAIGELARRYFAGHGPAQLRDLVWWSGLTQAEARRGIEIAGAALSEREIEGVRYWFDARLTWPRTAPRATAHLLPNFDEYTVGYSDRSAMLHPERPFRADLFAFSSILSNVVVVGGRLCGAWRRVTNGRQPVVEIRPLAALDASEKEPVELAGRRLGRFLGRELRLVWM